VKSKSSKSKKGRGNRGNSNYHGVKNRIISTKLIIRNLHPSFTLEWFKSQMKEVGYELDTDVSVLYHLEGGLFVVVEDTKKVNDFMIRLGKLSSFPKEQTPSPTDDNVDSHWKKKHNDNEMLYVVEHAPFQQIAKAGNQKVKKENTSSIENDSYYKKFVLSLETEEKLPSAEVAYSSKLDALQVAKTAAMAKGLDSIEADKVAKKEIEPQKVSALVQYLNSLSSNSSSSRSSRNKSSHSSSSNSSSSKSKSGKTKGTSGKGTTRSSKKHETRTSSSSSNRNSSSAKQIKQKHPKILLKKKDGNDPVGAAVHAATTAIANTSLGDASSNTTSTTSAPFSKHKNNTKKKRPRTRKKKVDTKSGDRQKKNSGD
jgi:hypothetical protein